VNPAHFCNGAKPLRSKSWVVDLESVRVFFRSYEELDEPDAVNRVLERLEPCKAVLPLSEAAERTVIRHLGISTKRVEVVYPAIKPQQDAPLSQPSEQDMPAYAQPLDSPPKAIRLLHIIDFVDKYIQKVLLEII